MFARRWQVVAFAYVAVSVVAAVAAGFFVEGRRELLTAWLAVAAIHVILPLLTVPWTIRQLARPDRLPYRLWSVAWVITYSANVVIFMIGAQGRDDLRVVLPVMAFTGATLVGIGNTITLHGRSGQRALLLDVVDPLMATVAITGPVALLAARAAVESTNAWLTITAAILAVGMVHALVALGSLYARLSPDRRSNVLVALVFTLIAMCDTASLATMAVTDFEVFPPVVLGTHAACLGSAFLFAAYAVREPSPGLGRLPPQRQVRKNGPLTGLLTASAVVIGVEAVWRGDEAWVVVTAMGLLTTLVLLSALRQLGLGRETVRLYGEVERAADERRELLSEVMRYVDTDRPRAAAALHRQAVSLYTAIASFAEASLAARQMRVDLARQVESAEQILRAMRSDAPDHEGLRRLVALTRAHVGNLYGDAPRPALEVSIDERLVVDWTHEVVVFRIVQMAVDNVWRHAQASIIELSMTAPDGALTVEVVDDGVGFEPDNVEAGTGIAAMRSLAGFVDGWVEVDSSPGSGTRVCAVVGQATAAPTPPSVTRRPALRLVQDA